MSPSAAWKVDPVEDVEPATTGKSYAERLAESGALDRAEAIFDALDRGENPFTESASVADVLDEARRRQAD